MPFQRIPDDVIKQGHSGVEVIKGHERPVMGNAELQTEKGQASGQDFLQQEPEVGGPLWESGRSCLPGDARTKQQVTDYLSRKLLSRARKWPWDSNSPTRQPGTCPQTSNRRLRPRECTQPDSNVSQKIQTIGKIDGGGFSLASSGMDQVPKH